MAITQKPLSSREKMQRYRNKLRQSGLRPVQYWVPDTKSEAFMKEARRQSLLVGQSRSEQEIMDFIDHAADLEGWE